MATRPRPDWQQIETDYRAGQKTLRQMGAEHGISHTAVSKRAKRDSWQRGLSLKIAAKASTSAIPQAGKPEKIKPEQEGQVQQITPAREAPEPVETNTQAQAQIILSQRLEIPRARTLAARMLRELEAQTCNLEGFEHLGQLLATSGDKEQEKQLELLRKALSLSSRVSTLKSLTDILKILVALERQVFDIEGEQPRTPIEGLTDEQVKQRLMRLMAKVKA